MSKPTISTFIAIGVVGILVLSVACSKTPEISKTQTSSTSENVTAVAIDGARKALLEAGLHTANADIKDVKAMKLAHGTTWHVIGKIESNGFQEEFSAFVYTDPIIVCQAVSIVDENNTWDIFEKGEPNGGLNKADIAELLQHRTAE